MSGIMQRRPIILYETLEALYQQVNAPFCAQQREKFLARAARRCAPPSGAPAGGADRPV